ncbi:zinc-binding protein A33-like [Trichomycterus rosablanca]|uniref:zinc-binding protein A33-like n=1 Tax=Trichomycterus rosablanca TaxID=2290929 RepID=UPI002F3527D8
MDSSLSLEIQCSMCLCDFTDPVTLPCEHSFCHHCITGHLQTSLGPSCCPECRSPYTDQDLRRNRLLRNMTDTVRGHLENQQTRSISCPPSRAPSNTLICTEHDEILKLFCVTDQKLVCVVCRDGEKHRGHEFKPVKEAAQGVKSTVKGTLGFLIKENKELDHLSNKQTLEATKTQMRSKDLKAQISAEFEEMHRFLRKKEEEVKKKLDTEETNIVEKMCRNKYIINERLMTGKELEIICQSALDIDQPDHFLQWWNEKGLSVTEGMKAKSNKGPEIKYNSRVKDLKVMPHTLFLGPLETHLKFFVWKEMLETIKPVPELLNLKDTTDSYLKLSPGKLSVRQADRQSGYYKEYNPGVISTETYDRGQHYWEFEVGKKLDWSIGVTTEMKKKAKEKQTNEVHLHLKHDKGYTLTSHDKEMSIGIKRKPSQIGLYLDCERKVVSFYDADIMSLIFQSSYTSDLPCAVSLFPGIYLDGKNIDPVTVCSYAI